MAGHVLIGSLTGLLLLMVYVLLVGDPSRAMPVWLVGCATGAVGSFTVHNTLHLRRARRPA